MSKVNYHTVIFQAPSKNIAKGKKRAHKPNIPIREKYTCTKGMF